MLSRPLRPGVQPVFLLHESECISINKIYAQVIYNLQKLFTLVKTQLGGLIYLFDQQRQVIHNATMDAFNELSQPYTENSAQGFIQQDSLVVEQMINQVNQAIQKIQDLLAQISQQFVTLPTILTEE
jgi:hypothetical protein